MLKNYYILCKTVFTLALIVITKEIYGRDSIHPSEYLDPDEDSDSFNLLPLLVLASIIYAFSNLFKIFSELKASITVIQKTVIVCGAISIVVMGLGFFKLRYEYYTFLRYVVSITAFLYILYELKSPTDGAHHWKVYFIIILLFHNPIYPVHIGSKTIWSFIDFLTGSVFFAQGQAIFTYYRKKDETKKVM